MFIPLSQLFLGYQVAVGEFETVEKHKYEFIYQARNAMRMSIFIVRGSDVDKCVSGSWLLIWM